MRNHLLNDPNENINSVTHKRRLKKKYRSKRWAKKLLKAAAVGALGFVLWNTPTLTLPEAQAYPGENCTYDWHPPPCGIPPKPVKSWLQQQLEGLEQYHFSAGQVAGVIWVAACTPGSTGDPRVDQVRRTACGMATGIGAFMAGMVVWEKRLIEQLNAARDGGTQFVVQEPPRLMATVSFESTGDPYLDALDDHTNTIAWLGDMINESVRVTFICDDWALTDMDGVRCGQAQRAWTNQLLIYMGQRVSAVSGIEDYFVAVLQQDSDIVPSDFIEFIDYDSDVSGWEGWNLQQ